MILNIFIDTYVVCFKYETYECPRCLRSLELQMVSCSHLRETQTKIVPPYQAETELAVPYQTGTSRSSRNHGTVERIASFHTFSTQRL
jgi:hypothetical protein